jgi:hypothetical protein
MIVASSRDHNVPAPGGALQSPSPSPAPGGISVSGGAGGGGGFSIFLTLAALLALGAPWATRRLRLASELGPLAPFVLIPDRPG